MQGVYAITNSVSGRAYIGSAVDIDRRWCWHRSRLKHGTHHNLPLQRAWSKYGDGAFVFTVREVVEDASQLMAKEAEHIAAVSLRYNTCRETGRPPNAKGRVMSPQARAKMAAAHRGLKHTPTTRAKMSAAWRPRDTPESRAKLSARAKGRVLSPAHRAKICAVLDRSRGRKLSVETKAKLAAIMTGRRHSEAAKAKMSRVHKGVPKSAEHRAKIAAAHELRGWVRRTLAEYDRATGVQY